MATVSGPAHSGVLAPEAGEPTSPRHAGNAVWCKIAALFILAATFFIYLPALAYQFVYDDIAQIVLNPHVHSWRYLPVYFTQSIWSQIPNNDTNLYRPLFLLWLRLSEALFADQPAYWHAATLATHLLATALVYLLARRILKNRSAALLGTAIFGFHPVHVEAVAWVSGVPEPLGAAFFVGALLCYLRQREKGKWRHLWLAFSLLLFAAGMLVKETIAALPLVIVAYELTLGRQPQEGKQAESGFPAWRGLASYGITLTVYLGARRIVMGPLHPGEMPLASSLLSWPWLLWTYVRMVFWPARLSVSYDFPYVQHAGDSRFVVPLLGVLAGGWVLWSWYRNGRFRREVFLVLWFLITLAPALAAFCLAYADESYHDRYLYLPSVGIALVAGALLGKLCEPRRKFRRIAGWGVAGAILLGLGAAARRQIGYWENNYALFQRAHAVAPHNQRAALNFGAELMQSREYRRALALSEEIISSHPDSQRAISNAGFCELVLRDYPAAENYYLRAAELSPQDGKPLYLVGLVRLHREHYQAAAEALRGAVALSPKEPFYHYTLGVALMKTGKWAAAKKQFAAEMQLGAGASQEVAKRGWWEAEGQIRRAAAPGRN
jgi:tetratricopeptide (TPR) repeat protein